MSPRLVGPRRRAEGGCIFLGRGSSFLANEILRADRNMALDRPGDGVLALGGIKRSDVRSAGMPPPSRKGGWGRAGIAQSR